MENKTPDYQLKAAKKWYDKNKKTYKDITIRLNKKNEDDIKILNYLDNTNNRTAKIKELILKEIEKQS